MELESGDAVEVFQRVDSFLHVLTTVCVLRFAIYREEDGGSDFRFQFCVSHTTSRYINPFVFINALKKGPRNVFGCFW